MNVNDDGSDRVMAQNDKPVRPPAENRAYQEARRRAYKRLIGTYPEVWRAIFAEELERIVEERPEAWGHKPRPRKVLKR